MILNLRKWFLILKNGNVILFIIKRNFYCCRIKPTYMSTLILCYAVSEMFGKYVIFVWNVWWNLVKYFRKNIKFVYCYLQQNIVNYFTASPLAGIILTLSLSGWTIVNAQSFMRCLQFRGVSRDYLTFGRINHANSGAKWMSIGTRSFETELRGRTPRARELHAS